MTIDLRRRDLFAVAGLAAAGLSAAEASATDQADFLFVQTSQAMTYDAATKKLTLVGVSPVTLYFSDRPDRIAGNMTTAAFIPFWSKGTDSFLADPPNADLSVIENGALKQSVVVLREPRLEGGALSYTVEIVDGEPAASGEAASLFIDIIGMPRTPLSYAGVARRSFRRAVIY